MRIPIPVAVLIAVLMVAGLWWLRTRNMDFLTPKGTMRPLPEFMTRRAGDDRPPEPIVVDPGTVDPGTLTTPGKPDQPPLDFGDLESSPGLAEYSEHASRGAGYLIRLATELEVRGQWERSLLAWERVIDSCTPSAAERTIAEDSIVRIRPTLPFWNIDPEGDLPLLLQLGTARPSTENLKAASQAVAEFIRKDSDHTLLVTPQITTSGGTNTQAGAPIAIYFSGTGEAKENESDLLSLTPADDEEATYRKQLLTTAYLLVRRKLQSAHAGRIVPPRPPSHPDQPELDFTRQITRLHWILFAHSLIDFRPNSGN